MAMTMTRTRTQTALNKLVELVANINGELEFLAGLLAQEHPKEVRARLLTRQVRLKADRAALFVTIRQFDSGLTPDEIASSPGWRKRYSRRPLSSETLKRRYLASHALSSTPIAH